jgi:hypothetical protein
VTHRANKDGAIQRIQWENYTVPVDGPESRTPGTDGLSEAVTQLSRMAGKMSQSAASLYAFRSSAVFAQSMA